MTLVNLSSLYLATVEELKNLAYEEHLSRAGLLTCHCPGSLFTKQEQSSVTTNNTKGCRCRVKHAAWHQDSMVKRWVRQRDSKCLGEQ